MPSSPVAFPRHFLPWDRPWLPQVAAWLARDFDGGGPLDLSATLAIVPTRQSARRLREALAEYAAARGTAVFPPQTHTPDTLLATGAAGAATRMESLLAWTEVLRRVELDAVAAVFPVAPAQRDFTWAWRIAEKFFQLQTQLMEGGLAFADVATRVPADFPERERWAQLALLEEMQVAALAACGRREPHAARRDWARPAAVPPGIRRIVLLALPDPLPAALELLAMWAREVPVEAVIFAPPEESDAFDACGRPLSSAWSGRTVELRDFEQSVIACPDSVGEAERATVLAARYPEPDGLIALGIADPDVVSPLERELSRASIAAYNPEGRPHKTGGFHALLTALAALARDPNFAAVATLARCPEMFGFLGACVGETYSTGEFLAQLDDLHGRNLPADLAVAIAAAGDDGSPLAAGLRAIEAVRVVLVRGEFPHNAITALTLIFGGRRLNLADGGEAGLADAFEAWRGVMRECDAARTNFPDPSTGDWWEIALRMFGESRRAEEKPPGALELQGWLELLWEDAPHLIVAGFNDGLVPDAVVGDAFLPESLREILGLKTNAARFARDAYLLQAMAQSRASAGRLDLLFARNSAAGDPLRPSRLLLRCADAELPARVAFLFRPVEATRPNLPWSRAWKMAPRRTPPPTRVAVTGLRAWLACPFRFYLSHVLKMEPVDPFKAELDARDFGTLCHTALEAMGRAPALRDCTDEETLREFLVAELDRVARARFGRNPALPLVVQLESARQRLGKVAAIQAQARAEGWVSERIEWPFTLNLGGLEVRGKIDRVDRHEGTGALRVLDYKTSDAATPPQKSHLRAPRSEDDAKPPWLRAMSGGREQIWADLQLPLYLRALAAEFPGTPLSGGYINLPKAAGDTALALWPELDEALRESADTCADGVAAAIRAGEFWPPADLASARDPFGALFHHGVEDSVTWAEATP